MAGNNLVDAAFRYLRKRERAREHQRLVQSMRQHQQMQMAGQPVALQSVAKSPPPAWPWPTAPAAEWEAIETGPPSLETTMTSTTIDNAFTVNGKPHTELIEIGKALALPEGVWIAGGACRRSFVGSSLEVGDIDLFAWWTKLEDMGNLMRSRGAKELKTRSGKQWGLQHELEIGDKRYRVQLIGFRGYTSPEETVGGFDITACMAAYVPANGSWIQSDSFDFDNRARRLRFARASRSATTTLKRMEKYVNLGYSFDDEDRLRLAQMLKAAPVGKADNSEGDDYIEG